MKIDQRNELNKKIRTFEEQSSQLGVIESEKKIGEILSLLLTEEGYEVNLNTTTHDKAIDFIAVKNEMNSLASTTIAIEYKHLNRIASVEHVHKLLELSLLQKYQRLILLTNTKFTDTARIALKQVDPIAIELMDINSLKIWASNIEIEKVSDKLEIDQIIKITSQCFAKRIARDPSELYKLEWRDLERMLAEVFDGIGFRVELTPGSKDGGKDIVLSCKVFGQNKTYIVEVKHWRSGKRVGQVAVKDFLNVIVKESRDSGLYLSTFGFCDNAFESLSEIEKQKVRFGDQEKIVALCKTYTKVSSGIWSSSQGLAEILFQETV